MATNLHFCDPELHGKELALATFFLKLENRTTNNTVRFDSWAACDEHVRFAYWAINPRGDEYVTIRSLVSAPTTEGK